MPTWVGPLAAIALAVIATSLVVMGGVVVAVGLGLRRAKREIRAHLAGFTADARTATARLRTEVEGFADLSGETRKKLRSAVHRVEERLTDLDALVEVLQEEAEETALDVAALVRTARRPAALFGVARSALRARRRRR
jgi:ABC-type Na+ transport system ATPase subunit NatA